MPTLTPSVASGFVKLTGVAVTATTALTNVVDFRDADNNSYDSLNMEMFTEFSLTIDNVGATDLTDVKVEHSPDGVKWEADAGIEDSGFFDGIPAGEIRSLENISNLRSFFRVRTQVAAGSTDVRINIQARAA